MMSQFERRCQNYDCGACEACYYSAMTNEQLFEDLKQYINGRLSQTEVRLDGIDDRLDCIDDRLNGIDGRLDQLGTDMRDGFAGVGEALETRSDDVDRRLTTLETKAV